MASRITSATKIASLFIAGLASVVLLGWAFNLSLVTTVMPGLASMKVNTAMCFLLLGFSIFLLQQNNNSAHGVSRALAIAVLSIASLTVLQYAANINLGIDELLIIDTNPNSVYPGRMSLFTAICFISLAIASLLTRGEQATAIFSAMGVTAFISLSVLVSHLYSLILSREVVSFTSMALHTSLLFFLATLTLFSIQKNTVAKAVFADDPLGRQTRLLLIGTVLLPTLVGWLLSLGEAAGLLPVDFARAIFTGAIFTVFAMLVLQSSTRLRHVEETRDLLEVDFQNTQLQLQVMVENSPVGIFTKDAERRYQLVNQNLADILGKRPEDLIGHRSEDISPNQSVTSLATLEDKRILSGDLPLAQSEYHDQASGMTLFNTRFPLPDSQGNIRGIGGIVIDVTERAKLIEDLRRSNSELEQFAYVASHDLQEPLRMVSSYMQLLESRYRDNLDQDAKDFIDFAVDGANRMQRLIQDLLAFSRVGTRGKDPEPVESREALDMALRNLTNTIDQNEAQLEIGELPEIKADFNQLVLVFQNLISNAIKFRSEAPPLIQITAQLNGDMAEFSIKDNGIGFDTKHTDRIFVIFQRLNNRAQYGGTGIGLAICKKIIERLGGRIWVDSREGHGSTFHFSLPLTDAVIRNFRPTTTKDQAETVEERAGRML